MPTPLLTPLPFIQAIAWARARQVVLPEVYYGELQGLARAQAFTVAGLTSLDQLQQVQDSLVRVLESGETFARWQQRIRDGEIPLPFGQAQIETVFRNTIQQSYNRGRYEQQMRVLDSHPYWLYDAVNDSRTRPTHAAMDGYTARHDDPIWAQWTPACGHRCRCRRIALTERQAARYQADDQRRLADPEAAEERQHALQMGPDPGWGHDPYQDPHRGLRQAIAQRQAGCAGSGQLAARPSGDLGCRHPALMAALEDMTRALAQSQDPAHLLRGVLTPDTYERLADAARGATQAAGLTEPQGVMLRAYTDRDLDAWPLMNALARALPHTAPLDLTGVELYRAGIMIQVMDAALAALPSRSGEFRRGQWLDGLGARRDAFVRAHSRPGRVVQWNGYTSMMDGDPYGGDVQQVIWTDQAKDISQFSLAGEPELLLPRSLKWKIEDVTSRPDVLFIEVVESNAAGPVRREYQFHAN